MRLLDRPTTMPVTSRGDPVRRRRMQLGLGYTLVPAVIILVFTVSEAIGGETGWWGHLLQLVPILGLAALAWARPLIGGPVLLVAAVVLGIWLLLGADEVGDAMGAVVLLCGPMLVAGGFFMAAGAPEE